MYLQNNVHCFITVNEDKKEHGFFKLKFMLLSAFLIFRIGSILFFRSFSRLNNTKPFNKRIFMKFNSIQNIRYSFLVLALLVHATVKPILNANEQQVVNIFREFIDPAKNPQKPFARYAHDIITLLRTDAKYVPVCMTLQELVDKKCKNPVEFLFKFRRYESLLPHEVREMFSQKTSKEQQVMVAVFKKRLTA